MTDFAISIFNLVNNRGYVAPRLHIDYFEEDTGGQWSITCAGTRAYLIRFNDSLVRDMREQGADSHFMARRLTSALLLGAAGLFVAKPVGRVLLLDAEGPISFACDLDPLQRSDGIDTIGDWLQALCQHTPLRRAADDAHNALVFPQEAFVYIYRGFEWIHTGVGISWEDLAKDMGIPVSEFKVLKKMANYESGVRHASRSGAKMRANLEVYGTWVGGLFEAINAARARIEQDFKPMTADEIAAAVRQAWSVPYE